MAFTRLGITDAPAQLPFVGLLSSCGVLFAHLLNRGRTNHHAVAFAETREYGRLRERSRAIGHLDLKAESAVNGRCLPWQNPVQYGT